ncbi:MAG: hypothetical protein QHJ81_15390 [Anaerolineae bacterium]|nr:hypothetical protein [Anaerolineae bacterium]
MSIRQRILLILILLTLPLLLPADTIPADRALDFQVAALVNGRGFNLALWEVSALAGKLRDLVADPAGHLDDAAARQLVLDYVATARRIGELEEAITRARGNPQQPLADGAIAAWQAELEALRGRQAQRRDVVEAILERQVTSVLAEEGLTTLGLVWPPLKFHFSEPPLYLIVSPRQVIALRKGVHLRAGLTISEREEIEAAVDSALPAYVSLVEDIGGFGAYPTMVIDNASLSWILDTIAHEWTHNVLAFRPLGWHYFDSNDTVTLNETVASIVGEEIGARLLERYYPQEVPSLRPPISERRPLNIPELVPPRFDFNGEMRHTRLRVDELLAAGRVAEAEAFMEAQRQRFVAEGYALRKLNQAYFAFHGSYATAPSAVDPIGPKMTRLREASSSLRAFLETVSRFTRVEDLDHALEGTVGW